MPGLMLVTAAVVRCSHSLPACWPGASISPGRWRSSPPMIHENVAVSDRWDIPVNLDLDQITGGGIEIDEAGSLRITPMRIIP